MAVLRFIAKSLDHKIELSPIIYFEHHKQLSWDSKKKSLQSQVDDKIKRLNISNIAQWVLVNDLKQSTRADHISFKVLVSDCPKFIQPLDHPIF